MKTVETRQALIQAAQDFLTTTTEIERNGVVYSDLPILDIENIGWENVKFENTTVNLWCSVFYRPNQPVSRAIGSFGIDEINGFMQIDFNIPENTGESVLLDWEKKARLFFFHGKHLPFGDHFVLVTSSGMSQGRQVQNNFRRSLTVAFKSHIKK